ADAVDDRPLGARGNAFGDGRTQPGAASTVDTHPGATYVVFGKTAGWTAELDLGDLHDLNGVGNSQGLGDGSAGFVIRGIAKSDQSGFQIAGLNDINGDGFDEVMIGAREADPNGNKSGQAYIVFGGNGFGAEVMAEDLDGTNGYVLNGVSAGDYFGKAVSDAGDVNG